MENNNHQMITKFFELNYENKYTDFYSEKVQLISSHQNQNIIHTMSQRYN